MIAVIMGLPTLAAPGSALAQVAYTGAFGFFVVLSWLGVRARAGRARIAHALLAGSLTVWLAGDLLYALLVWQLGELGEVSAADGLWVLGYPLLAAGLIRMVRLRVSGRLREALLDGLAMATVVAALFWQFMIRPAFTGHAMSPEVLFTAFYPFGDVLLFAAGALLVFSPGPRRGPNRYLVVALAITFFGDVAISMAAQLLPDVDSEPLDAMLLLANSLFAAALWHRDAGQLTESAAADRQRLHPARVVFLGVSLLALPALADLPITDAVIGRMTMLTAMTLLTVIVLIRFTLVVREQERVRSALAHRATHDQLTGLVNRQELHARMTAALRNGAGPVVHFLDLNGFKSINDRHGHAAGDFVLAEVARRLCAEVRHTDTVARLGGDEFVVMSAGADEPAAMTERLRRAVTAPIRYDGRHLTVGVSVGMAVAADVAQPSSDALLAAADTDMYREKDAQRTPAPI